MKALYKSLSILFLVVLTSAFQSCEKQNLPTEATGSFELFLSLDNEDFSGLKSVVIPDSLTVSPYHALLTVIGRDSVPVLEDELIPLYKFGEGFFSEKIELKAGGYRLLKFLIVDPEGEVLYAAPMEGSPMAYLVKDPLPIGFKIQPEETTRLVPEVLPVNNEPPSEFGYSSFGFSVVRPLPFHIAVILDNPMIMDPAISSSFAPTRFTNAVLSVYHPDGWSYDFRLEAKVNRVVIRGGAEYYKFIIEKEGFEPVKMEVPAKKLLESTPENPMLVRIGYGHNLLVLQPDPDHGFDAMISDLEPDKNFGKHPYFEATWRSEPILTVMRENRSLIRFSLTGLPKSARIEKVTLKLFHDVPIKWDSLMRKDSLRTTAKEFVWYGAVLQQIVEPWEEHEVTWGNRPKTIEANQVYVSPIHNYHTYDAAGNKVLSNFIEVDVTKLFVPEQEIAAPNYGMMFKLSPNAEYFKGFRFTSSDFEKPVMRPVLKVHYSLPVM